jgi:hydrogenase-4 membrane subunit HyfE
MIRAGQLLGVLGGVAWIAAAVVWDGGEDPLELGLFWAGAALVTVFLVFAAQAADDDALIWGIAGGIVLLLAVVLLARPAPRGATL